MKRNPFPSFDEAILVNVIHHGDGVLSYYQVGGINYFVSWLQLTREGRHQWLVIRVSDELLEKFMTKKITLLEVLWRSKEFYTVQGWIIKPTEATKVNLAQLLQQQKPSKDSFFIEGMTQGQIPLRKTSQGFIGVTK